MSTLKFRIRMFIKYKGLIRELVSRDLKLKYRRSFLGYLWSILNPLLVMIVMTVVFSAMFSRNIENYPVYLLIGRMTFDFMTTSTNQAMNSVTGNAALLKKTYIPKYIFTVAKVTSALVKLEARPDAPQESPKSLLKFAAACLRMRRKTLYNNLTGTPALKAVLESMGLPADVRGEALTPEQLLTLYRRVNEN